MSYSGSDICPSTTLSVQGSPVIEWCSSSALSRSSLSIERKIVNGQRVPGAQEKGGRFKRGFHSINTAFHRLLHLIEYVAT